MNLNLVQICGRLTKKPETKTTQGGIVIGSFSVATNRQWKNKQGEKQKEVEFHNVTVFGKTAEIISQYFDKGDEIYIQGRIKTNSWEDKSGAKKYRTDIIAEKFDFGQKAKTNKPKAAQTEQDGYIDENGKISMSEVDTINIEQIPF